MSNAGTRCFAVADIGSNTVKYSVFSCSPTEGLNEHVSDADTVRIGHRVSETGLISDDRIERLIAALNRFADTARTCGATDFHAVATQAFRVANNARSVIERIERETPWRLRVIDADEETRLTLVGARPWLEQGATTLVADIGGASTELVTAGPDGTPGASGSVPIGSGVLFDEVIQSSPPPPGSMPLARARAEAALDDSGLLPPHADRLLLPGGTGHFLSLLADTLRPGSAFSPDSLPALAEWLSARDATDTMDRIPVQEDRARVLPASLSIVEALVLRVTPQRLVAIPSGIRNAIARKFCEDG